MKDVLKIDSDIKNLQSAIKWIEDRVNLNPKKKMGFILSAQEVVVNAIKHGNQEDKTKSVYLTLQIDEKSINLTIRDEGEGVKESNLHQEVDLLKESGRGILIMRTYCDEVKFKGNSVELKINL